MTDKNTETSPKRPSHTAYTVRKYGDGKSEWLKIGVAWPQKGGGLDTQLYALPLDGRIVLRPIEEKKDN